MATLCRLSVYGVLSAITNIGTVMGPIIAGYIFDTSSSYQIGLALFLVIDVVAALLVLFVCPYGFEYFARLPQPLEKAILGREEVGKWLERKLLLPRMASLV